MGHFVDWFVTAVFPNLVASLIAFGAALGWHHKRTTALLASLHERVDYLHEKVDAWTEPDADDDEESLVLAAVEPARIPDRSYHFPAGGSS